LTIYCVGDKIQTVLINLSISADIYIVGDNAFYVRQNEKR